MMSLMELLKGKISKGKIKSIDKIAIQVDLLGEDIEHFYIEIKDGKLSVQPYEYIDRDILVKVKRDDLNKILIKKLTIENALNKGLLYVYGDLRKALIFKNSIGL